MLQSGCAPGAIYAFDNDNGWWSALAAYTQKMPACPELNAQIWYSPAAAWVMITHTQYQVLQPPNNFTALAKLHRL